jgi:hypothetical protein
MAEVRKHPPCSNVTGIAIDGGPGRDWSFALVFDGQRHDPECKMRVEEAVRQLQAKYHLA